MARKLAQHSSKTSMPAPARLIHKYLTAVDGTLFFSASTAEGGDELWKSDGTEAGTTLVKDIRAGTGSSSPVYLTAVDGTLFFRAYTPEGGYELWKSDGTETGTIKVWDFGPFSNVSSPFAF